MTLVVQFNDLVLKICLYVYWMRLQSTLVSFNHDHSLLFNFNQGAFYINCRL